MTQAEYDEVIRRLADKNMIHELEALRKFKFKVRLLIMAARCVDAFSVIDEELREVIDSIDALDKTFGKVGERDGV